jgi:hypothetical protein
MSNKQDKAFQYAMGLLDKVQEFINKNPDVLSTDENATEFFHALGNIVPAYTYNKLTGENVDFLTNNHNMNRICFQFMKNED